jgi:hypothetical protein
VQTRKRSLFLPFMDVDAKMLETRTLKAFSNEMAPKDPYF